MARLRQRDGRRGAVGLDTSRSPPEIAYAIGGIVHNYFRTRGVTLTSYELRRLVAELLTLRQHAEPAPLVDLHGRATRRRNVVDGRRAGPAGTGRARCRFQGPPSPLIDRAPRDSDAALLAAVTAKARGELVAMPEGRIAREAAAAAIDAALDAVLAGEPERRSAWRGWP